MKRACWIAGLVGAVSLGCLEDTNPAGTVTTTSTGTSGSGGGSQGMSETGTPTTGGSSGSSSGSTGVAGTGPTGSMGASTTGTTGCSFIGCGTDDGGCVEDCCDVFAQDCTEGEKCSAWASDGGTSWDAAKCVPVMENPKQPGEPCMVEGNGVSGIDNCDLGSYCFDTDAENMGVCFALCKGTIEAPFCEQPFWVCAITGDGNLNLCLEGCNPLVQDCDPTDVCIADLSGEFICILDASGDEGQQHDPCMFANECDPGLLCLDDATAAVECDPMADGCCEPFCDLSDPDADVKCGGVGQVCNPYFEMGMVPPWYENVGYCAIPM
jgi:hypothetical protein